MPKKFDIGVADRHNVEDLVKLLKTCGYKCKLSKHKDFAECHNEKGDYVSVFLPAFIEDQME